MGKRKQREANLQKAADKFRSLMDSRAYYAVVSTTEATDRLAVRAIYAAAGDNIDEMETVYVKIRSPLGDVVLRSLFIAKDKADRKKLFAALGRPLTEAERDSENFATRDMILIAPDDSLLGAAAGAAAGLVLEQLYNMGRV